MGTCNFVLPLLESLTEERGLLWEEVTVNHLEIFLFWYTHLSNDLQIILAVCSRFSYVYTHRISSAFFWFITGVPDYQVKIIRIKVIWVTRSSQLRVDLISDFEVDIRSCLLRKTICLLKLYISLSFWDDNSKLS